MAKTTILRTNRILERRQRRESPTQREILPVGKVEALKLGAICRPVLVPHTNVYIASAAGHLPSQINRLLDRSTLFHCSVSLAQLSLRVGGPSPLSPGWGAMTEHYRKLLKLIPATRVLTPDDFTRREADRIADVLAAKHGLGVAERRVYLDDALFYLTTAQAGLSILAPNLVSLRRIHALAANGRWVVI